jgi:O-antigen ligase
MSSFAAIQNRKSSTAAAARANYQELLPRSSSRIGLKAGAFFALHAPLALLIRQSPNIGLVHAVVVLVGGVWWISAERKPERAAYICAYIVGAEVLWRMTKTPLFWEFGKYAAIFVFLFALLRQSRLKIPMLPIAYFALLLPSLLLTFSSLGFTESRMQSSFNLSGPLAIMMSAVYISQLRLTQEQQHRLLMVIVGPICGVATIVLYNTLTKTAIVFNNSSNFETSGGFGPNQVSSILGLAALITYIYLLDRKSSLSVKVLSIGLVFLFATLSALTFSRNGLFLAGCSALAFSIVHFRNNRARLKFAIVLILLSAGTYYVILPRLIDFTSGAIASRFEERSTTGRDTMVIADLRVWWDHPFFGVGPGMARPYYDAVLGVGRSIPAHTEFSRLLSEHGIFGLVSMLLLLFMALNNLKRAGDRQNKSLLIGLLVWSFLYMAANAMRLMAPAFIYGITFARVLSESSPNPRAYRTLFDNYQDKRLTAARSSTRFYR